MANEAALGRTTVAKRARIKYLVRARTTRSSAVSKERQRGATAVGGTTVALCTIIWTNHDADVQGWCKEQRYGPGTALWSTTIRAGRHTVECNNRAGCDMTGQLGKERQCGIMVTH